MIFVTVGTHEQPFDRLMEAIDALETDEPIIVQSGYSKYRFKKPNIKAEPMLANALMNQYSKEASVVITHGGPGSIFTALVYGKKPVVVPRQKAFGEHVNDHQVEFAKYMEKQGMVRAVIDIKDLPEAIAGCRGEVGAYVPKTDTFVEKLEKEIEGLLKQEK